MMSENVIVEKIADKVQDLFLDDSDDIDPSWGQILEAIESATRPEQFMPPLEDWPEWAMWCAISANGTVCWSEAEEPKIHNAESTWITDAVGPGLNWLEFVPHGIDWRTLKVSREQMEAYENG